MSDFDFDALRDPVAPEPGARAACRCRRAGARAAGSGAAFPSARERGRDRRRRRRSRPASSPRSREHRSVDHRREPQHDLTADHDTDDVRAVGRTAGSSRRRRRRTGARAPVTLPDGEPFTLRYPPAMEIAQLGFARVDRRERQARSDHATRRCSTPTDGSPVATLPGRRRRNGLALPREPAQRITSDPTSTSSCIQFGQVARPRRSTAPSAADQARMGAQPHRHHRRQRLPRAARGPLRSPSATRSKAAFGECPATRSSSRRTSTAASPSRTRARAGAQTNGDGTEFVSWCEGTLHVSAEGSPAFLDHAEHDLQISRSPGTPDDDDDHDDRAASSASTGGIGELRLAGSRLGARAGRRVAETTDGGTTWRTVGSLGNGRATARRSASPTRSTASRSDPAERIRPLLVDRRRRRDLDPARHAVRRHVRPRRSRAASSTRSRCKRATRTSGSGRRRSITSHWIEDPLVAPDRRGPGAVRSQLVFSGNERLARRDRP